jgi:hypothetical protein
MTLDALRIPGAPGMTMTGNRAVTSGVVAIIAGPHARAPRRNYRGDSSVVRGAGGPAGSRFPDIEEQ